MKLIEILELMDKFDEEDCYINGHKNTDHFESMLHGQREVTKLYIVTDEFGEYFGIATEVK